MTKVSLRVVEGGGGEGGAPDEPPDPIIEECVADALAPYRALLSPAELEEHRRFLVLFIKTHPAASALYDRLRARRVGKASGDVPKENWMSEAIVEELRERVEGGKR